MLLFLLLTGSMTASAQKEGSVWCLNGHGGFDFNTGVPVATGSGMHFNNENYGHMGSATIASAKGQLQFYTDGNCIWDRTHSLMPNGGILPSGSYTSGSAVIIQDPANETKYYVFCTSRGPLNAMVSNYYLYCTVVDMNLRNGYGDVVTGKKAMLIDSNLAGVITPVAGEHCSAWLLTRSVLANEYKVRHITIAGIDPVPVISSAGIVNPTIGICTIEDLKATPDRTRVAATVKKETSAFGTVHYRGLELYDFDPATGLLSNTRVLDSISNYTPGNYYPICCGSEHAPVKLSFSPNSSKLYTSIDSMYIPPFMSMGGGFNFLYAIMQFDVSLPTTAAMKASKTFVGGAADARTDLRTAYDGKLYVEARVLGPNLAWGWSWWDGLALYAFDAPDNPGLASQFNPTPVNLSAGASMCCTGELPSDIVVFPIDTVRTRKAFCFEDTAFLLASDTGGWNYRWNNGASGKSRIVNGTGTFVLTYRTPCTYHIDSFVTTKVPPDFLAFDLGNDSVICENQHVLLGGGVPGASFLWQDGSTDSVLFARQSGVFSVQVSMGGCMREDSVQLTFHQLSFDLGTFPPLCLGEHMTLDPRLTVPGLSYTWQDGSHDPVFQVSDSGKYWLTVEKDVCKKSDTALIAYRPCNCEGLFVPTAFSPNGDGRNDRFGPPESAGFTVIEFLVFNRWGEHVFTGNNTQRRWDGYYKGEVAPAGVYYYRLWVDCNSTRTVTLSGDVTLVR